MYSYIKNVFIYNLSIYMHLSTKLFTLYSTQYFFYAYIFKINYQLTFGVLLLCTYALRIVHLVSFYYFYT